MLPAWVEIPMSDSHFRGIQCRGVAEKTKSGQIPWFAGKTNLG